MMTAHPSTKIDSKLFIGCRISSEIRMHLNKSIQWKHATILAEGLKEVCYQDKEYLGFYLQSKKLTIKELGFFQQNIRQQLHIYCPALATEQLEIFIFPQVFLA